MTVLPEADDVSTSLVGVAAPPETPKPAGSAQAWFVGGATVFGILMFLAVATSQRAPSSLATNEAVAGNITMVTGADPIANTSAEAPSNPWVYSTDEDLVRGAPTYYATTTSTNMVRQDFPYDAATTMDIVVRKSPAYGTDVILRISSGQLMCPSYEGCSGTVRFDDGPGQRVRFNGAADNSSDTIFVIGASSFISKLKKAKRVVIEKTLYEAGNPQFEFDVAGLKWDH